MTTPWLCSSCQTGSRPAISSAPHLPGTRHVCQPCHPRRMEARPARKCRGAIWTTTTNEQLSSVQKWCILLVLSHTQELALIHSKAIDVQLFIIPYVAKSLSAAHVSKSESLRDAAYRACDVAFTYSHSSHVTFHLFMKVCKSQLGFHFPQTYHPCRLSPPLSTWKQLTLPTTEQRRRVLELLSIQEQCKSLIGFKPASKTS